MLGLFVGYLLGTCWVPVGYRRTIRNRCSKSQLMSVATFHRVRCPALGDDVRIPDTTLGLS